jgi:hypothetical protein
MQHVNKEVQVHEIIAAITGFLALGLVLMVMNAGVQEIRKERKEINELIERNRNA